MFTKSPWLGQVPLILGPSSWGAGGVPVVGFQMPIPPYFGDWGSPGKDSGRVGPFDTAQDAFRAASEAAPQDGWVRVTDSRGQLVAPIA